MRRAICEVVEWDSGFFDRKIGRVLSETLCENTAEQIMSWAAKESIDCLYFLASASDQLTIILAERHGFLLVDTRVTLELLFRSPPALALKSAALIRRFTPDDLPALQAIARAGHQDTRFYHDTNFPRQRCDALYEMWITKSCAGWADAVWVAVLKDEPVGYITCHLDPDNGGRIGLVAVDSRFHRLGIGRELLTAALEWFPANGAKRVSVVTQGRNARAIQFYTTCNFSINATALWFHKWFSPEPAR